MNDALEIQRIDNILTYTASVRKCSIADIDECKLRKDDCEQRCGNFQGLYNCYCYFGYTINDDRKTCEKSKSINVFACDRKMMVTCISINIENKF